MMSQSTRSVAVFLSTSLSLGVFFLQFLEWFYSSENQSLVKTFTSLPVPPPPLHLQVDCHEDVQVAADKNCPLCFKLQNNSTVLSTSGFVFCYRCIYAYVKVNHCCPLTGFPTELQHLIKIYEPES